ncbi:hypothetical protein ACWGOK_40410 [Streptomyces eurythermus]
MASIDLAGTELGDTLDHLTQYNDPDLNLLVTAIRRLATRELTLTETQTLGVALAGDIDSMDATGAIGLLHAHLHNPTTNPALTRLPFDQQDTAAQYGKATAHALTDSQLRNTASLACASLAHSGQCSNCGAWFENWPGGICDACRNR